MAVIATKQANGSFADQVFDEVVGSARKWFTLQGNLLDGTFHPIPANGSEQVGYIGAYPADANGNIQRPALNFDGVNDRIGIAHSTSLDVDANFTIEVVCKSTRDADWSIISKTDKYFATGTAGWHISTAGVPADLLFEIQNGTSRAYARFNVGRVFDFAHFAAVKSGSTILTYTNGLYQSTATLSGSVSNTLNILVGALGSSYFFQGIVKEVRIWNYARTQAEIQRDMNKPLRGDEPGLVSYWTMDEGSGSMVYDKTVNANHGTIYGATWTQVPSASVVRWKLDTPRSAHKLRVHGDTQRNIYPVDFDIQLYDANAALVLGRQVRGNAQVQWSEVLSQVYDFQVMDVTVYKMSAASSVVLTEASNEFSMVRQDTLLPKPVDATSLVGVSIWAADALLSKLADGRLSTTASFVKADTLSSKIADSSFFRQYEFRRTDLLLPKTQETSVPVTNQFTKVDTLLPKISDQQKAIIVLLYKNDSAVVDSRVEADAITVEFSSADILAALLADAKTLTNVHTRMDEDARTVYGRVEITYTDPFMDPVVAVTASSTGRYTYPEQTADNIVQPKYKWFSLHDNKLDGTYHPMPSDKSLSVGWWSAEISDANGVFAVPQVLTMVFSEPRPIYELRVAGDPLLDNFPVDFTIQLYDVNNTLLYEEVVTGNVASVWREDIGDVIGVKTLTLVVNKINKPYQPAKITEFYTSVVEVYEGDKIESISLLEELEYPSSTIMLGAVSANEVDITLDNIDGRFNLGNTDSPLNGLLKQNRRVRVWLGVEVIPGEIEWHLLGVFWTTFWSVPDQSVWVHLTARDSLELLRQTDFVTSQVYQNYSAYQLAELILQDAGLTINDYTIDPALQQIVIPYAWFDRMSHRDALQRLAGTSVIQVYCDRLGKIHVEKTQPTPTVIYQFDDDKNIFSKDFPLVWGQVANYIEVVSTQWAPTDLQVVCDSAEVIDVPPGQDVAVTYAFSSVPVVDVQAPVITAGPDIVVSSYVAYAWGVKVTYRNNGASTEQVTHVQVTGRPLQQQGSSVVVAKDDASIRDLGKIKASIQHDFIQTTTYAQVLANELLALSKNARQDIVLSTRGNIALELGDRITAPSHLQGAISEYMVKRQELKWAGYLEATVEGQKIAS